MDKSSKHAVRVLEYDSLLKLLKSYAKTSAAKEQISDLLPTANIVLIKKQISETSELKDLILSGNHLPLGSVENILPIITNHALSGASLEPDQLLSVASTLQTVNDIRTYSHGNRDIAPLLWLSAIDLAPQPEIISEIYRCIDSDKTVKDAATKKLLLLRRSKTKLRTTINRKLNSLINSSELKSALENKTITSRNGRPVIAMKSNFRNAVRGSLLDKSNSGFTSFIEPHVITETVNELESVRYEERKEIARILRELSVSIFAVKESLIENIRILTYIDITNAKAQFSYDYQMTAPEINDSGRLILFEARHPLLMHFIRDNFSENISPMPIEKVKSKVVSLSIKFDNKLNLIIITGPNTGGKTVALKTLGLLTLMAQSGMHIPASAGTTMPIFKKIFADIGDEQSIEQSLSTFSSHLNNIARVINNADSDTLVLLDELGSGTDPAEGAALATSILNFLHSSGTKVIATTHLGSLKTFAYSTSGAENASMEFDEKTLKPTYKLLVGQPGSSNALAIARRLGLKEEIIKHAEKLISGKENDNSKLINKVQQLRVIAERGIKESQKLSSKLKREIEEIKKERKKITEVVNAEVESIFKDVKSVVNEFSKAAVNAPPPWNKRAEEFKKRINELADGTPLARQRERFIKNLSSGKSVFVQSLNCYAIVKTINHGKKTVVVESDGVNFKISFNKILERPFSQPVKKKVKKEIKPEKKKIIKHHPAKVKNFIKNLKEGDAVYSTALSSVVIVDTINHEKKKLVVKFGGFPTELPFYKVSPVATKKDKDLAE